MELQNERPWWLAMFGAGGKLGFDAQKRKTIRPDGPGRDDTASTKEIDLERVDLEDSCVLSKEVRAYTEDPNVHHAERLLMLKALFARETEAGQ